MDTIDSEVFTQAVASLLDEIHVSPPNARATWVTSNQDGSGFLGTLDTVSAEMASRPPAPGVNTIAAHAAHLRFSLSLAVRAFRGENPYGSADWAGSWKTQAVDEAAWAELRADLRRLHGELTAAVRAMTAWTSADLLKGTIGLVGHGAYHLGAMRALLQVLQARER